jgi:diazepam-binding inhibitor (GABA receptor modulating acyl-CoA-binding protein)
MPESAMASLKDKFAAAAKDAVKLPKEPNNDDKLEIYALYKQASAGDVKGNRPGFLDMVGRAKYDAWSKKKGLAGDAAMQAYIDFIAKLKKSQEPAARFA